MSVTDAEKAFYDSLLTGDGTLQDSRYQFFLAGAGGAVPYIDPDDLQSGYTPQWDSVNGKWVLGAPVKGDKGDTGAKGDTGHKGDKGDTGDTGPAGPEGGGSSPAASEMVPGVVELATPAEVTTGTDTTRAVTPAGLAVELNKKASLASPTLTGTPLAPTPATADNTTKVATTAFVKAQGYATLASPTLTGDPKAPTPATADNDTSIATTAFVKAQGYATTASVFSKLDTSAAPELIRDTMGTALVAGSNVIITPNDAGDTITIASSGGGGGGISSPSPKSGEYLFNAVSAGAVNNATAPVSGTLYCVPFYNYGQTFTADRIAIQNGAVGAGGAIARLGAYTVTPGGQIGTLLFDAGTVDMTTGGDKNIVISQPIPSHSIILLVMVLNDTTCRPRMVGGVRTASPFFWRGASGPVPTPATLAWLSYTGYSAGSALPSTGATAGETPQSADIPMISLRAA